jgi:hypothetical protein
VGIAAKGFSAIGKLVAVAVLLGAFLAAMAGVVYMSLSGSELKVPEITGKDFVESEKELAALGLRIKRRADRTSTEPINTVLEQLPKAGETVKTGQMILVVVSKAGETADDTPSSLKKNVDADDTEKIEEMISDKPKKAKSNSNTNKKKVDTTRDVIANTATSTSNSASGDASGTKTDDANKKDPGGEKKDGEKPGTKPQNPPGVVKPAFPKPKP